MYYKAEQEITQNWKSVSINPVISICCITFNHQNYIAEAINSFLMQETNFPFEILIHDDASTDDTPIIIKKYEKAFPNIIKPIYQAENQYQECSLMNSRFNFPRAKGKYIALCEGDDYWTDCTKLQKQADFLEGNPNYVITYTDSQPFDENGLIIKDFGGATRDLSSNELLKSIPIYTLTTCFRNVIKEIPCDLLSARYGDRIIWSLLGAYGSGKYLSDIKPSAYRMHNGGVHSKVSIKESSDMRLITFIALFSYYKRIGNTEISHYFKKKAFISMLRGYIGI